MNAKPEQIEMLSTGADFKIINEARPAKTMATLLKIKYLFWCSDFHKIDFKEMMSSLGIHACPETLDVLQMIPISERSLNAIEYLYASRRQIDWLERLDIPDSFGLCRAEKKETAIRLADYKNIDGLYLG